MTARIAKLKAKSGIVEPQEVPESIDAFRVRDVRAFKKSLNALKRIVSLKSRNSPDWAECYVFDVRGESVGVEGANKGMEIAARFKVDGAEGLAPGRYLVPRGAIDDAISIIGGPFVVVEGEAQTTFRSESRKGRVELGFPTKDATTFPAIPKWTGKVWFEVKASDLAALLQETVGAIDENSARFALGGVNIQFHADPGDAQDGVCEACGTDGRFLEVERRPTRYAASEGVSGASEKLALMRTIRTCVLPKTAVLAIQDALARVAPDDVVKIRTVERFFETKEFDEHGRAITRPLERTRSAEQVYFRLPGALLAVKCLEGRFPDYRSILEGDPAATIAVNSGLAPEIHKGMIAVEKIAPKDVMATCVMKFKASGASIERKGESRSLTYNIEFAGPYDPECRIHVDASKMLKCMSHHHEGFTLKLLDRHSRDGSRIIFESGSHVSVLMPVSGETIRPEGEEKSEQGVVVEGRTTLSRDQYAATLAPPAEESNEQPES